MFSDRSDERKHRETFLAACDTVTRTSLHLSQYLDLHKDFETSTRLLLWIDKLHLFQLFLIDQLHASLRAAQPRDLSSDDKAKVESTHTAIDTASTALMNGVTEVSRDVALTLKNGVQLTTDTLTDKVDALERQLQQWNAWSQETRESVDKANEHLSVLDVEIGEDRDRFCKIEGQEQTISDDLKEVSRQLYQLTSFSGKGQAEVDSLSNRVESLAHNSQRDAEIVTSSVVKLADRLNNLRSDLNGAEIKIQNLESASDSRLSQNEARLEELNHEVIQLRRELQELRENRSRSLSRSPPRRIPRISRLPRLFRSSRRPFDQPTGPVPYVRVGTRSGSQKDDSEHQPIGSVPYVRVGTRPEPQKDNSEQPSEESSESDGSKFMRSKGFDCGFTKFKFWRPEDVPVSLDRSARSVPPWKSKGNPQRDPQDSLNTGVPVPETQSDSEKKTTELDDLPNLVSISVPPPPSPPPLPPPLPPPRRHRYRGILREPMLGGSCDIVNNPFQDFVKSNRSEDIPIKSRPKIEFFDDSDCFQTISNVKSDSFFYPVSASETQPSPENPSPKCDPCTKDAEAASNLDAPSPEIPNPHYAEVIRIEPTNPVVIEP